MLPANPRLSEIIKLPEPGERQQQLLNLLSNMGQAPDHPDWPLLFDYFTLAKEFTPNALDPVRLLIQQPETLTLALFKSTDETFERIWSLAEVMPFSWGLFSMRIWERSARQYFDYLRSSLLEVPDHETMVFELFRQFRLRASSHRKYWNVLCDWLQTGLFPGFALPVNCEFRIAQHEQAENIFDQQTNILQPELQARHDGDWPENPVVMGFIQALNPQPNWVALYEQLGECHRPIRYAPYLAAHIALTGIIPPANLIHELRLLRQFDPIWFDQVYAIRLALGLAQLPPENNP